MCEYQISVYSTPVIRFAHKHESDIYTGRKEVVPQRMELTYILQGNFHMIYRDQTNIVPCNSIILNIYDHPVMFSVPEYHKHATISIDMQYKHVLKGGIILPHVMPFGTPDNPVRERIEQLILQYNLEPDSPLNIAMLMELLGKISFLYLTTKHASQTPGQAEYVRKAKMYVIEHLAEPLQVTDIARHLDISVGYLSRLFTELQGQTLSRYINTIRIQRIEEMVLTYGLNIREAGRQVGLMDPNYASRLFRRIRGCSISELRSVHKTENSTY